jgi:hypothetical protein
MEVYIMTIQNTKRSVVLAAMLVASTASIFAGSEAQLSSESTPQVKPSLVAKVKNFVVNNKKNIAIGAAVLAFLSLDIFLAIKFATGPSTRNLTTGRRSGRRRLTSRYERPW